MLIAIDSSIGTSVAVVDRDRGVLAECGSDDTRRHAEVVGTLLREAMDEAGIAVRDVDAVAAGMGPGPFTGLRIGIAAARAFAFGAGIPVLPVVSHDAIAADELARLGEDGERRELLVTTDARRRERYVSRYRGTDAAGLPSRVDGPAIRRPDEIEAGTALRVDADRVRAGRIGVLALRARAAGVAPASDEPLYLRSPDVTPSAGKRVSA